MTTQLVPGHALIAEGAAHDEEGRRKRFSGTAGPGFGKCQCGEISPFLRSGGQRQKWHRDHKDDVLLTTKVNRALRG